VAGVNYKFRRIASAELLPARVVASPEMLPAMVCEDVPFSQKVENATFLVESALL
jgi:hypothetical protein